MRSNESMKAVRPTILLLCCLLTGCGGKISISNHSQSSLRAMNDFVDVSRVSANVSGTPVLQSQPFSTFSGFEQVDSGNQSVNFFDASSHLLLVTRQAGLVTGDRYEAIGVGTLAKGRKIMLLSVQPAINGVTELRFANADENHISVDVYLTPSGTTDLTGLTPMEKGVAYGDDTVPAFNVGAGSYRIWITPPNLPGNPIGGFDQTLPSSSNITVVLVTGPSGLVMQQLQDSAA